MFYVFCNNNSNNNNTEQFKDWGFRGKKIFGPARCSHLFLNIPVATGSWLSFLRDVFLSLLCSATGQFPVRPLGLEGMWICAWICAYLEGEALLGLSGKKGSCLPRLCILGRPSFEFSGSIFSSNRYWGQPTQKWTLSSALPFWKHLILALRYQAAPSLLPSPLHQAEAIPPATLAKVLCSTSITRWKEKQENLRKQGEGQRKRRNCRA